jgi:O-antigen/teichoic acid export membrane protein
LVLYAAVRSLTPLLAQILAVTGNSGFVAKATFWTSVALPLGFYFSAKWGPAGIAAAWVVLYPISAIPLYWRTFREIRLSFWEYCKALLVPVEGTLLVSCAVLLVKYFLPAHLPVAIQLAIQVATGVLTYLAFFVCFQPDHIRRVKQAATVLRSKAS